MRTSVFQYPYEKVVKRTKRAFSRMGLRIVNSNDEGQLIATKSGIFPWNPIMNVVVAFEDIGNNYTRVTVKGEDPGTPLFFRRPSIEKREIEILEALSVAV